MMIYRHKKSRKTPAFKGQNIISYESMYLKILLTINPNMGVNAVVNTINITFSALLLPHTQENSQHIQT
jgi:hypothetical protein